MRLKTLDYRELPVDLPLPHEKPENARCQSLPSLGCDSALLADIADKSIALDAALDKSEKSDECLG